MCHLEIFSFRIGHIELVIFKQYPIDFLEPVLSVLCLSFKLLSLVVVGYGCLRFVLCLCRRKHRVTGRGTFCFVILLGA